MPIRTTCVCGRAFAAPDHLAGKRVRCPGCGEPVRIPGQAAANLPAEPEPHPEPAPPPADKPEGFDEAAADAPWPEGAGVEAAEGVEFPSEPPPYPDDGGTVADHGPAPAATLDYRRRGAARPHPPAPPGDTELGWQISAVLLFINAVANVVSFIYLSVLAADPVGAGTSRRPASTSSGLPATIAIPMVVGAGISLAACVGLLMRAVWAKWTALVLAALTAVSPVVTAMRLNERQLPLNSRIPVFAVAALGLVAWMILLERPTNRPKVTVGAVLAAAWLAATFWIGYSIEP